jgi:hypothetical protein
MTLTSWELNSGGHGEGDCVHDRPFPLGCWTIDILAERLSSIESIAAIFANGPNQICLNSNDTSGPRRALNTYGGAAARNKV